MCRLVVGSPFYTRDAATLLCVTPRTIRRWASGEARVPLGIWRELEEALGGRLVDGEEGSPR